jgi:hypothetical protein
LEGKRPIADACEEMHLVIMVYLLGFKNFDSGTKHIAGRQRTIVNQALEPLAAVGVVVGVKARHAAPPFKIGHHMRHLRSWLNEHIVVD